MIFTGGAPGGPYENPLWYLDDPDYNAEIADLSVEFFGKYLTHTKGRWAGNKFHLFPWQEHRLTRPLFGLLKEPPSDKYPIGLRRIKKVYCEIPKKNGKSEYVAGVGLKGLAGDKEAGAEVYTAASDKGQANIIHGVSTQMIRNNEKLNSLCKITDSIKRVNLLTESGVLTNSFYQALSADVPTKHGINVHYCLFDELHAQPNKKLWSVLTEGSTVARQQPIILSITTAGWDQESVCWKEREYAVKWLKGEIKNDAYLAVIYGMDAEEDWENEENWKLINPSMYWEQQKNGRSYWTDISGELIPKQKDPPGIFSLDEFRADYQETKDKPYKINEFRQRRCNQWTNQDVAVIDMKDWDNCGGRFKIEDMYERPCYPGLDLSLTHDITACAYVFPLENGYVKIIWDLWLPEKNVKKLIENETAASFPQWIDEGWITLTPGNIIDYDFIKKRIIDTQSLFEIRELSYDPWKATQVALQLQGEGFTVVPTRQTFGAMSEPTKRMLDLIKSGKWGHGDNPVVRWMGSNFSVLTDTNENIRPNKAKPNKRIDGLVAAIIGLSGMILNYNEDEEYDPYAEEGPMVL